jgi:hypothetical protein
MCIAGVVRVVIAQSSWYRYNKRAEDFSSLREYNDYLESVEDIGLELVFWRSLPSVLFSDITRVW